MNETENITAPTQEQEKTTAPVKKWKSWFSNDWVAKNMYYFLFLAVLAVVYIYNGHYAENTIKDINRTAKELKELQYEYKTVKGELMMRGKQSELAKAVEPLGLQELKTPPVKIVASEEK
ncbi:MAG: hypothetical protein IT249_01375 [Chitinophagaceae bacterium]|nr:hypothetical protein [Chitinophagaceae bacterium]